MPSGFQARSKPRRAFTSHTLPLDSAATSLRSNTVRIRDVDNRTCERPDWLLRTLGSRKPLTFWRDVS